MWCADRVLTRFTFVMSGCYDNGVDRSDLRNNVTFQGLSLHVAIYSCSRVARQKIKRNVKRCFFLFSGAASPAAITARDGTRVVPSRGSDYNSNTLPPVQNTNSGKGIILV